MINSKTMVDYLFVNEYFNLEILENNRCYKNKKLESVTTTNHSVRILMHNGHINTQSVFIS